MDDETINGVPGAENDNESVQVEARVTDLASTLSNTVMTATSAASAASTYKRHKWRRMVTKKAKETPTLGSPGTVSLGPLSGPLIRAPTRKAPDPSKQGDN